MVSLLKLKVTLLNKTSMFAGRKVNVESCPGFLTIDEYHLLGTKPRKKEPTPFIWTLNMWSESTLAHVIGAEIRA